MHWKKNEAAWQLHTNRAGAHRKIDIAQQTHIGTSGRGRGDRVQPVVYMSSSEEKLKAREFT
eukprot:3656782-Rhodomonas_salina.1